MTRFQLKSHPIMMSQIVYAYVYVYATFNNRIRASELIIERNYRHIWVSFVDK